MQSVYKCKACDYGPCYCQTAWRPEENMFGDDENCDRPFHCPYFGDQEQTDFNLVNPEIRLNTKFAAAMEEWLCGVGYDDAPEDLRDAVYGCGMEPRGIDAGKALDACRNSTPSGPDSSGDLGFSNLSTIFAASESLGLLVASAIGAEELK